MDNPNVNLENAIEKIKELNKLSDTMMSINTYTKYFGHIPLYVGTKMLSATGAYFTWNPIECKKYNCIPFNLKSKRSLFGADNDGKFMVKIRGSFIDVYDGDDGDDNPDDKIPRTENHFYYGFYKYITRSNMKDYSERAMNITNGEIYQCEDCRNIYGRQKLYDDEWEDRCKDNVFLCRSCYRSYRIRMDRG